MKRFQRIGILGLLSLLVMTKALAQDKCPYIVATGSATLGLAIGDVLCPDCPASGTCPGPNDRNFRAIVVGPGNVEDVIDVRHQHNFCEACQGKMGYTVETVSGCSCKLFGSTGKSVPDSGSYTFSSNFGEIFLGGPPVTTVSSCVVHSTNSLDPSDSTKIIAVVTSASALTSAFTNPATGKAIGTTSWTLGQPVAGCANKVTFDKSHTSSSVLNVSGCVVFNVSGGLSQNGVVTMVDGNFDPAGVRDILLFGQSTNLDIVQLAAANTVPAVSTLGLVLLLGSLSLTGIYALVLRRLRARTALPSRKG